VNLLTGYHGCKVLVELLLVLNEKQAAAADACDVTFFLNDGLIHLLYVDLQNKWLCF
jgi:hypothetical protein